MLAFIPSVWDFVVSTDHLLALVKTLADVNYLERQLCFTHSATGHENTFQVMLFISELNMQAPA